MEIPRRTAAAIYDVLTDDGIRPALLFLLALGFGAGSVLLFLLRDGGGGPTRIELGLQFASVGVLFYLSMMSAGEGAPRRGGPE